MYLKFLMNVQVKKVPKKRITERKKMSGTYSQEWERTPMNLKMSKRNCVEEKTETLTVCNA